jgi:hypothetical protein
MERLVALTLLAAIGVYLAAAWLLPRGTVERPGPGFYPVVVGVFGAVVALTWVLGTLRRPAALPAESGAPGDLVTATGPALGRPARLRVIATATLLVAFCLGLSRVGYPLAALVFVALALRGMGARWLPAILMALVSAGVSYYVFGVLLGVPLPSGVLFD